MSPYPVIGLLGGGQLGRMLCQAAAPLGIQIAVLDAENAPAKQISHSSYHVNGSYKDAEKIRELATHCGVLSVETEHIDATVLEEIATCTNVTVHPSWRTLRLIQDKYEQKAYLGKKGVPVAEQMIIEASGDAIYDSLLAVSAKFGFPWMLKARKDSYDGRGNMKISSKADLDRAAAEFGNLLCYAENYVPYKCELSVLVIRTEDDEGRMKQPVPYPAVETVHEDNVCSRVYMPPRATLRSLRKSAELVACNVVDLLWGRGVFAVEMFLTQDNELLVNEVAPRPHNSGHLFYEVVPYMSQFKAQLTSILDEPLPAVLEPHVSSSMMVNILGGINPDSHFPLIKMAKSIYEDKMAVYLYLYGKEAKPATITRIEEFGKPLVEIASEIRQERLKAQSKALRPEQAFIKPPAPLVLVTIGSDSDLPVLKAGLDVLTQFGMPWEVDIISAHRTPAKMGEVATLAASRGIKIIIAAAGGAAHLPGMLAAYTSLPVIGVPVKATHLDGLDSLLNIVQMPRGVPIAMVGINNPVNAALLAVRFLGAFIPTLQEKMRIYQNDMKMQVEDKATLLREIDVEAYLARMNK